MFPSAVRSVYARSKVPFGPASKLAGATGAVVLLHHTSYLRAPASTMAETCGEKTAFSPKVEKVFAPRLFAVAPPPY